MARDGYSVSVTPFKTQICGLPVSTLTATIVAVVLYVISVILLIAANNCPFDREKIYFFTFLLIAIVAVCLMAVINIMYPRYRFNALSLTVSLLYSGSAALVLLGLIMTAAEGLCAGGPQTKLVGGQLNFGEGPKTGIFKSKSVINYLVWFGTLIGWGFQVVAHYFYG